MNFKNLNCPQFVNFGAPEFLCTEFSSISLDAPDWSVSTKKSEETKLVKDEKKEAKEKLNSELQTKESSDEKENQESKINPPKHIGMKRKFTGLSLRTGKEVTANSKEMASCKPANLEPLKLMRPPNTVFSPQLPVVKRRRLASALEDTHKTINKNLHTEKLKTKDLDPKNKDKGMVQISEKKNAHEIFKFKARPIPTYILKGQRCQKPKEVKNDLKTRIPLLSKPPPINLKKPSEVQPDKEKFQDKNEKPKEFQKEKKMFVFSAQPKPKVAPPAMPSKLPCKPEPFRFGLDKCIKNVSKNCKTFKARPATVLKKEPFVPKPSTKLGIEVHEFKLHTQQRAAERRQKQLAELERLQMNRVDRFQKFKDDRAEILRRRREIFERYHIKIQPLERQLTTGTESTGNDNK